MEREKIARFVENGLEDNTVCSPMNPPESHELSQKMAIPYENLAKPLQILVDEHREYLVVLDAFEQALADFRTSGFIMDEKISKTFGNYFEFVDKHVMAHNHKEEKSLFPLLRSRFIATGECSPGMNVTTPTDVMEDEHLRVAQASNLVFNLLGLGAKMRDVEDRRVIFMHATEQGREIVEIMRLHIFRENNVLFPLAQKLITEDEFSDIGRKMAIETQFSV
jgi:hemerythrin-like domain-containing protein